MWTYDQNTGNLSRDGVFNGRGYSGAGVGKNNSAVQHVSHVGPIPRGGYMIYAPFDSPQHGPFVMRLIGEPSNEMFGRSGFLMHGDSIEYPGTASQGCIIMPRTVREAVWASGDHELMVV